MNSDLHISSDVVTSALDTDLLHRELTTLRPVLLHPVTADALDHWAAKSTIRADILANTVWGEIRWRKHIGRPLAATLASAFVIEHTSWQWVKEFKGGAVTYIQLLVPHPAPQKHDGPDDDTYHRVSFMAEANQHESEIRVRFAPHVGWDGRVQLIGPGYKTIEPAARVFLKASNREVLEPFEVIVKPYALSSR